MCRLEEYKLIKEAGERLKTLENVNRFYKPPDESTADYHYVLRSLTLEGLLDAFSGMLHKVAKERVPVPPKEIKKDRFTVAEKMLRIKDVIAARRTVSFFELFERDYSRSEIINTFLALLELLKLQLVRAEQNGVYEDITITYNETAAELNAGDIAAGADEYGGKAELNAGDTAGGYNETAGGGDGHADEL
jgi:segregation and condensation protein A